MGVDLAIVLIGSIVVALFILIVLLKSVHRIGPTQVGLVTKRFGFRKLPDDNPIAFRGEAGYQATLLMPGMRIKLWPISTVEKFPWVQVPAGEIGVVIAQVGRPLPIGAKSAHYRPEFGNYGNLRDFLDHGGEKGVQRPVLPPGTLAVTPRTYASPVRPRRPRSRRSVWPRRKRPRRWAWPARPGSPRSARRSARCRRPWSRWPERSPKAASRSCRRSWSPVAAGA